jgi:hypothetical protein
MNMTVKSTGRKMQAIFIDQEALEFAKQNMRTKQRLEKCQKAKEERNRFKKEMERNANRVLIDVLACGAVALAGTSGLIHPGLWVPFSVIALCGACVRLGMWFGKAVKK